MSVFLVSPAFLLVDKNIFPAHYTIYEIPPQTPMGLSCLVAIPDQYDPDLRPLVTVHGISRDVEGMVSYITQHLTPSMSRIVIAPLFDRQNWKGYQRVVDSCRADLALLSLLEDLKTRGIADTRKVELFGYSGGAQFAHRFALLYPHLIERLMVCSAGWYTFPDDRKYPYGLSVPKKRMAGYTTFSRRNLESFLKMRIEVYVGETDTIVDANTRSGREIDDQQGVHRLARARKWVAALQSAANRFTVQPDISYVELVGCGHSLRECIVYGNLVDHLYPHTHGSPERITK